LQFDKSRGYGFVAAQDGGEDIFLHASVFSGDPSVLIPGAEVEFQIMAGDRGRKAYGARLAEDESEIGEQPTRLAPVMTAAGNFLTQPLPEPPTEASPAEAIPVPDEEEMCDVLSLSEFRQEITELLLDSAPELTGQQILQVLRSMLELAKKHGWYDG
jgi:cold shock CspA family protein